MRDVVRDGHVRKEPDLLDHVADPAAELDRGEPAHAAAVDPDVALVERDEPVDHPQGRRLAAARGPTRTQNVPAGISSERSSTAAPSRPGVALRHVVEDDLGRAAHRFRIPDQADHAAGATSTAVITIASVEPGKVELSFCPAITAPTIAIPSSAGNPRDGVVDAARDPGVLRPGVGEHRRGQRRDRQREPDREDEDRRQEVAPVSRSRRRGERQQEAHCGDERPEPHEEPRAETHRRARRPGAESANITTSSGSEREPACERGVAGESAAGRGRGRSVSVESPA